MNEFIKIKNSIINKKEITFIQFNVKYNDIKIITKNNYEIIEHINDSKEFKELKEMLIETLIEIK